MKPAILKTSKGNVNNFSQIKQVINIGLAMLLSLNRICSLTFV